MQKTGPKPPPRKWWLLSSLFLSCAVVSFVSVIIVATLGIKRKDCPCEQTKNDYDVEFGKECCIQYDEYNVCSASQCLCATPENIATYDHLTGSVTTQFKASNIHCRDKEKTLERGAIVGVSILAVVGTGFLLAAAVSVCRCGKRKMESEDNAQASPNAKGFNVPNQDQPKAVPSPKKETKDVQETVSIPHAVVTIAPSISQATSEIQPWDEDAGQVEQ